MLMAGLVFLALVWEYLYEPKLTASPRTSLIFAFAFLSGSFLLRCLYSLILSTGAPGPELRPLVLFVPGLESLFFFLLLVSTGKSGSLKYLSVGGGLALLAALFLPQNNPGLFQGLETILPIAVLNCTLSGGVLLGTFKNTPLRKTTFQVGAALFALSCILDLTYHHQFMLAVWDTQHLIKLSGLSCFILFFEQEREHIFFQFFLRLNLVFIASACAFMLVLSDLERREHFEISATTSRNLGEFLRGHILYFHRQGEPPQSILESPEVNDQVVSQLGTIPNLREVKLELLGRQLRMAIDDEGMISYERGEGLFTTEEEHIYNYERRSVTILTVPIILEGNSIGAVILSEDLLTLSRRISAHMRVIFLSFTAIVLVAWVFLGLVVIRAHKIIQGQYKKLEEGSRELVQTSQLAAVGQLINVVAHEVNNPAGVIMIRSECALDAEDCPDTIKDDIREIRIQAAKMTKIVRNLLHFSRPQSLQPHPVDLNQLIPRTIASLDSHQSRNRVDIRLELDQFLPTVEGDPDRLEQVLINMGKNALDATRNGGILTFRTSVLGDSVKLEVEDNGIGMPPETAGRMFDPFFTTKEMDEGTGLGLAISKQIIKQHRGQIEVTSSSGKGTTISIFLPQARRQ
jgi:signal transduction histidine kinase